MSKHAVTLIYGIKGGHKIGSLDPMGGPEDEGLIWVARLGQEIVSVPEYPVTLEIEGYPEVRREKEPYTLVRISLRRTGLPESPARPIIVIMFDYPLHNLSERPSLATRALA